MKWVTVHLVILAVFTPVFGTKCYNNPVTIFRQWITIKPQCLGGMRRQIQMEVGASLQYLAMGAHFSRDDVNRPGFAATFFAAASEGRAHAIDLIGYLLMRGELTADVTSLLHRSIKVVPVAYYPIDEKEWLSGAAALEFALQLETEVTSHTRRVIASCEEDAFNDYHLADYLTGDFLTGQYRRQRNFAGKAATLKKMEERHQALGEFLFDKKLLGQQE